MCQTEHVWLLRQKELWKAFVSLAGICHDNAFVVLLFCLLADHRPLIGYILHVKTTAITLILHCSSTKLQLYCITDHKSIIWRTTQFVLEFWAGGKILRVKNEIKLIFKYYTWQHRNCFRPSRFCTGRLGDINWWRSVVNINTDTEECNFNIIQYIN